MREREKRTEKKRICGKARLAGFNGARSIAKMKMRLFALGQQRGS